ncbi:restriction endonuclease subunit S [Hydrogenovibrio crunogenus]|uniref:Restriction endonuclease subunit S n=1 Tax=Hydrogenovibrio crunogenus TaxID=39765 RepID=A0A4V1C8Q7_9GAMM|nr:hypothetical protein [Hydrogenovibrio crunogenus]QBZ82744.1 restriction endonuclease subunit S [Hydrogenovibrio crunogenus]
MKLKDCVTAFTGINTSKISKDSFTDGVEMGLITGQSINEYGEFESELAQTTWIVPGSAEKFLLLDNDIVIQIRGNVFKAGLFKQSEADTKQSYIASSNFVIMRVNTDFLQPEILVSYFNSSFFKENVIAATRSNTMLITLKKLLEHPIAIPCQSDQKALVSMFYRYADLQKKTLELFNQQKVVAETKLFDVLQRSNKDTK